MQCIGQLVCDCAIVSQARSYSCCDGVKSRAVVARMVADAVAKAEAQAAEEQAARDAAKTEYEAELATVSTRLTKSWPTLFGPHATPLTYPTYLVMTVCPPPPSTHLLTPTSWLDPGAANLT